MLKKNTLNFSVETTNKFERMAKTEVDVKLHHKKKEKKNYGE